MAPAIARDEKESPGGAKNAVGTAGAAAADVRTTDGIPTEADESLVFEAGGVAAVTGPAVLAMEEVAAGGATVMVAHGSSSSTGGGRGACVTPAAPPAAVL